MERGMARNVGPGIALVAAGIGLVGLGLLNLYHCDLLLQWQPAAKAAAFRTPLAYVSGIVLVVAGTGLFFIRTRRWAALLAAAWIGLWVVGLHVPATIQLKGQVAALLGIAECAAMALGLATAAGTFAGSRSRAVLAAAFGLCCIVFGISHFAYADFTARMVPAWIPAQLAVAYFTGAVHLAAGLCFVAGFAVRIAAIVEAMMMSSFVVLLHVPRVLAAPDDRLELTMLGIATLLTSAAWLIAGFVRAGYGPAWRRDLSRGATA